MKIIEVRDGIVKLETDGSTELASFIKIDDEKSYIAQIIQVKPAEKVAFAKILFNYDGGLYDYDKTQPQTNIEVSDFTSEMIKLILDSSNQIIIGKTQSGENIKIDSNTLDKKLLICSDDSVTENTIVRNLTKQINFSNKNVIVIDTTGDVKANKFAAGADFKLPLDKSSLKFIYEECLEDVTADSRAAIIDIFKNLTEYSQTVDFLPFDTLKNIVDEMVDKSHIFKLLVLKNKLAKFNRAGYFAKDKKEVEKICKIINSKCAIIDVSKLETAFINRYIEYIYETIDKNNTIIVLKLSNSVSKKTLKKVYENDTQTTFISHSQFKYIKEIKTLFDTFLVVPSINFNKIFEIYATFLRAMKSDSYLVIGKATKYVPFISSATPIDEQPAAKTILQNNKIEKNSDESISKDNEEYIDTAALVSNNEIIASIDEKSNDTISKIAENLESADNIEMFAGEDDDSKQDAAVIDENELAEALELNNEPSETTVEEVEIETKDTFTTDVHPSEVVITNDIIDIFPEETGTIIESDKENLEETEISEELIDPCETQNIEEQADSQEIDNNNSEEIDDTEISIELDDDINLDLDDDSSLTEESFVGDEKTEEFDELQEEIQEKVQEAPPTEAVPLEENGDFPADEIQEINLTEAGEDDILIDLSDENSEEMEAQVISEADKIYTTRDEEFSDSDLDLIDELNSDQNQELETLQEEGDEILEEISDNNEETTDILEDYETEKESSLNESEPAEILETRNSTTPVVPLYEADIPNEDMVESDPVQQGDSVTHVKYGNGVVEKLVKYGSKILYMINFDNGGRKLLDPLLTEIKKA